MEVKQEFYINDVFITKLIEYYDKQNSDIEFKITAKREWIQIFKVRPRGNCYYYDKLESIEVIH